MADTTWDAWLALRRDYEERHPDWSWEDDEPEEDYGEEDCDV